MNEFWGGDYEKLRKEFPVVKCIPFSSLQKCMSSLIKETNGDHILHHKGAAEIGF